MRIEVLGTRGEIEESSPRHSRHSGLLVDGRLLFDLGEPEFLARRPWRVLITHLHPDHAFFVGNPAPIGRLVYAPEKPGGAPDVEVFPRRMTVGPYRLRSLPTVHSLKVKSQAYLIETPSRKVLYTGDMLWIAKKYRHRLVGLDLVITEGSFMRRGGMVRRDASSGRVYGHAGIPDLVRLFRNFTPNMLFVHFGSWFYRDPREARRRIISLAKKAGVTAHVGYDGFKLTV